ncbi:MAG: hypothetical protein Q4G26_09375 [Paracoccus sp. (in: a-proteobacteria)]|nr:hypothetical protein [Paracoccus sp. (in: a-proteobacteria)]
MKASKRILMIGAVVIVLLLSGAIYLQWVFNTTEASGTAEASRRLWSVVGAGLPMLLVLFGGFYAAARRNERKTGA